ncbi:hypothetical protein JCM5353_006117 [Sporobolomyces roseus]
MAPKRPADAYTPSSFPTDRSTSSTSGKRQRYAPPNASKILGEPLADDLELDLEGTGGGGKDSSKNKVVTDGYDSDSSGGEDDPVVPTRKGKEKDKEGEEEDEDMFGELDETVDQEMNRMGKGKERERKQAGKEWLEMGDIEGQEFGKKDMRDDHDDDQGMEDEEGDEEDEEAEEEEYEQVDDHANDDDAPRSRRSKKGMGFQLSSFNMKEELAEGRFSADGSYVANSQDPLAAHDSWLSGLSKTQIRLAKEAKERQDAKNREMEQKEAMRGGEEQLTQLRDDCLIGLLKDVRQGETVAGSLNRLGRAKKRAEALRELDARQGQEEVELDQQEKSPNSVDRYMDKINRLTHFASTLLSSHGELEIYDQRYEDIVKTLKSEGAVRRDWVPPTDSKEDQELEAKEEIQWKEHERGQKEQTKSTKPAKEGRSRVVISRPTAATSSSSSGSAVSTKYWYKWNPAPEGQNPDEKYGPFERSELEGWINQGYFGDVVEASRILVKKDGENDEFRRWVEAK